MHAEHIRNFKICLGWGRARLCRRRRRRQHKDSNYFLLAKQ
jgi:hypothetical protein